MSTLQVPNKVTFEFLEKQITDVQYRKLTGTMTHCTITVLNGFTFTGESACADPSMYNKELGESLAYKQAMSKMWTPYGFVLKQQLHEESSDE